MKLFQKSALAVAIAAVPFLSVNAMEALDDATLSEMTGQAGVTIETTVDGTQGITIGSILYTDTAEGGSDDIGGGSVLIIGNAANEAGITLQGQTWNGTAWENGNSTTKRTIDVDVNGNLITKTEAVNGVRTLSNGDRVTAQKISVGQVLLQSKTQQEAYDGTYASVAGAQLVSNLAMTIESGDSAAHILNLSDTGSRAAYEGSDHALVGAGVADSTISKGLDGAQDKNANMAIITQGKSRIANLNVDALDGAIAVRGLSYGGGANGDQLMDSTQVIWAVGGAAYVDDGNGNMIDNGGGVYIQGSDSKGTLTIGALHIGGDLTATNGNTGNIGRIQISNINQAGSVTRIYGH